MSAGAGSAGALEASTLSRPHRWRVALADRAYRVALVGLTFAVPAIAGLIVFEMSRGAMPSIIASGAHFLVGTDWDPVADKFGALPYVYGTFVTSALALLFALPLGLGAAIFLAEIARPGIGSAITFVVEMLASIPSIVFGLWGVFVLAPWLRLAIEPWLIAHLGFLPLFQGFPFGLGILNAGLVLAIMILPTIVSLSREILRVTPGGLREAALALGATRAEAIGVMLDAARPGIVGAVILALGRALGETMAVTMVIGNTNRISASLLAPGATMASVIANEFTEATGKLHLSALIEIALLLFVMTLVVNGVARLLVYWSFGGRRDVAGAA